MNTLALIRTVVCAPGAGSWYDYYRYGARARQARLPVPQHVSTGVGPLRPPFIAMCSVLVAAIGLVGGLTLTATTFSVPAYTGVIVLAGIAVTNAILLVFPMSLGIGEGVGLQAPLVRVAIGGCAASTLMTPALVPSVYTVFEEGVTRSRRRAAHQSLERA